jgi:hypothetical protein
MTVGKGGLHPLVKTEHTALRKKQNCQQQDAEENIWTDMGEVQEVGEK